MVGRAIGLDAVVKVLLDKGAELESRDECSRMGARR